MVGLKPGREAGSAEIAGLRFFTAPAMALGYHDLTSISRMQACPMNLLVRLLLSGFLLVSAVAASPKGDGQGIHWYPGSVDEAFAEARKEGKPVFLYWGAVWCPPCNQLKATLFRNPAFVRKTRLFVPVYLDGDTEEAQKLGEKFGVLGYPTLILFTPEAEEITRLPGGMSMERYPEVLDLALARVKPVARLLHEILDEGRKPTAPELHLLAWYAWDLDRGKALGAREQVAVLARLVALTPDSLPREKARLNAAYLAALANRPTPPSPAEQADAVKRLEALMADTAGWRDNLGFFIYDLDTLIPRITDGGSPQRKELLAAWNRVLAGLQKDESLGGAYGLLVYSGKLHWLKAAGKDIPASLQAEIRKAVEEARARASTGHERVAVSYAAYGILKASGQLELAERLVSEEMQAGSNNQYWMLVLADLAEESGNGEEALNWYAKAWENARGAATRIQWGSYYIRQLTELTPDDDERIMNVSKALFAELAKQKAPFHGRNRRALERVFKALNAWGQVSSPAELIELKRAFVNTCLPFGKDAMERCEAIMKAS